MEKLNLQYFADESETTEATEATKTEETKSNEESKSKQPKYTDDDVDKIINAKFAEWAEKQKKAVDEAKRLEKMNAQERAEHERDELQKKYDELLAKETLRKMENTARGMLREENINAPDELISLLVSQDAEKTKKSVESFIALYSESVKTAVADALKGNPPKAGKTSTMTKEEILKIPNAVDRQKAISENINLFR